MTVSAHEERVLGPACATGGVLGLLAALWSIAYLFHLYPMPDGMVWWVFPASITFVFAGIAVGAAVILTVAVTALAIFT